MRLIPLFILERFLGPLPKIVPHYWANRALVEPDGAGLGLADVTVEMAVLLGFTALFFAVGLWRFDLTKRQSAAGIVSDGRARAR